MRLAAALTGILLAIPLMHRSAPKPIPVPPRHTVTASATPGEAR
jgi:hypothetical protein